MSMRIYVIRHADAVPLGEQGIQHDGERPLTPAGEKQCHVLAKALDRMGVRLEVLLASPLVRAQQTAKLILAGPTRLEECPPLKPGGKKRRVLDRVRETKAESIGLVGHNPDLGELVGWFVGEKKIGLDLEKSGVACIVFEGKPGRGDGVLEWMITPAWSEAVAG